MYHHKIMTEAEFLSKNNTVDVLRRAEDVPQIYQDHIFKRHEFKVAFPQ